MVILLYYSNVHLGLLGSRNTVKQFTMKINKAIQILPLLYALVNCRCHDRSIPNAISPRNVNHCPSDDSLNSYVTEVTKKYILCSPSNTCNCRERDDTWIQVGHLNMTNSSQSCPPAWDTINTTNVRGCGLRHARSCDSVFYSTGGLKYSEVCGRIIAYQYGRPEAFYTGTDDINSYYIHGVSLTHGLPRKHVWTFVNARDETADPLFLCPCMLSNSSTWTYSIPSFVENNYFCAAATRNKPNRQLYTDNPLWDGVGCSGNNTCCQFNQPPWFCRTLPAPTTDDLEVRICADYVTSDENTYISNLDLYVK